MIIPTMKVKIGEQVVIINVADFDEKIHKRIDDVAPTKPAKRTPKRDSRS